MSTPPSAPQSPTSPSDPNSPNNNSNKPRLTEEEKKQNHIASEQKRRAAIRAQFDRLAELTPGMAGQGRSEGQVLTHVVKFAREQVEERKRLIDEIEKRGEIVADGEKVF